MNSVEDFIYQYEGDQREVMLFLHDLLVNQYGLTEKIRYKVPFYYNRSWMIYLNPTNDSGIALSFIRGTELSNDNGILEDKGRKQVRSVDLYSVASIPQKEILEIIQEAIVLDETIPYASKRKK